MGMGTDDKINVMVSQPLSHLPLGVFHIMAALYTPMTADHQHIAIGAHGGNLLFNDIQVAQIHNAIGRTAGRRQAVGMFGVGKVAEGDAIHRLVHVVVIGFQVVEPHRNHVIWHRGPMLAGGIDARRTFIVAVVVGQAEHPEANVIQCICNISRR